MSEADARDLILTKNRERDRETARERMRKMRKGEVLLGEAGAGSVVEVRNRVQTQEGERVWRAERAREAGRHRHPSALDNASKVRKHGKAE